MNNLLHTKTAVLIFSLSQEAENIRKPFFYKKGISSKLNTLIKEKVSTLGVDYFHFTEERQQGKTFGERYVNAIATIFNKGYDNIVTVGNDTLGLEKKHLRSAIKAVENKQVPIGPSFDGGFYLLGLHKEQFDKKSFLSLPWESSNLYSELKTLLSKKEVDTYNLPYLYDLDDELDVVKNISSLSHLKTQILKLLQSLQVVVFATYNYILNTVTDVYLALLFNKGPPFVLK